MKKDELIELLEIVNPRREEGKVTLIARYGAQLVRFSSLTSLIDNEFAEYGESEANRSNNYYRIIFELFKNLVIQ